MATLVVRIEPDLDVALRQHAKARAMNKSEAVRDLLRRAVGTVSTEEQAGYRLGMDRARREHRHLQARVLALGDPSEP